VNTGSAGCGKASELDELAATWTWNWIGPLAPPFLKLATIAGARGEVPGAEALGLAREICAGGECVKAYLDAYPSRTICSQAIMASVASR
jgi:hypothetical protein